MDIGQAIGLASGICGLIAILWKVFSIISNLQRQIEKLESDYEREELIVNGIRERIEHVQKRNISSGQRLYDRVNYIEAWLTKHTEYESNIVR